MEPLHIAFFGATNSGKSTLVNAIAGQEVSLVSPVPGTTTDPVRKRIELPGLGPCVLIDTAGLGDEGALGAERERRTRAILDETDIAVLVLPDASGLREETVEAPSLRCESASHAVLRRTAGASPISSHPASGIDVLLQDAGIPTVSYTRGESVESLLERISAAVPKEEERFLTGRLVKPGDAVVLVMPQDSEAPKGRLILPQVQVIRELLDRGCNPLCTTPESLPAALSSLKGSPALVITDSQAFKAVNGTIPPTTPLTSFSILLAAAKGDIRTFVEGARAIDSLRPGDRVLIAEACTHVPDSEDIGRVKIPALLQRKVTATAAEGCGSLLRYSDERPLHINIAAGNDFPEDLSPYSLIIHCGACVATARLVRARTRKALLAGVPITNYGIALAALQAILPRVSLP